ncbi:MAG: hypothetical protein R8L53_05135 [Mariprofundales bacterium]
MHPFIIGELACGNLQHRQKLLSLLNTMPTLTIVKEQDVIASIAINNLMGRGLGYIDIHLLTAVMYDKHSFLWTRDKRLYAAAKSLNVAWQE